ncbi:MAG: hypothetical protein V1494_06930 [Candidatus Diapherotrites archaeon]
MAIGKGNKPRIPGKPRSLLPLTFVEGKKSGRSFAYTERARKFIRQNPGVIKDFLQAWARLLVEGKGASITVGETTVKFKREIGDTNGFLLRRGGKRLFVKEFTQLPGNVVFPGDRPMHYAPQQIAAMHKAEKILLKQGIEPIQYEFAFKSGKQSFLVSRFYSFKTVEEIQYSDEGLFDALDKRRARACKKLEALGIADLENHNCFYDPRRKIMLAFDLHFDKQ